MGAVHAQGNLREREREHGRIRSRLTFSWIKSRYQNRCLKASLRERVNVRGSPRETRRKARGREEGYRVCDGVDISTDTKV